MRKNGYYYKKRLTDKKYRSNESVFRPYSDHIGFEDLQDYSGERIIPDLIARVEENEQYESSKFQFVEAEMASISIYVYHALSGVVHTYLYVAVTSSCFWVINVSTASNLIDNAATTNVSRSYYQMRHIQVDLSLFTEIEQNEYGCFAYAVTQHGSLFYIGRVEVDNGWWNSADDDAQPRSVLAQGFESIYYKKARHEFPPKVISDINQLIDLANNPVNPSFELQNLPDPDTVAANGWPAGNFDSQYIFNMAHYVPNFLAIDRYLTTKFVDDYGPGVLICRVDNSAMAHNVAYPTFEMPQICVNNIIIIPDILAFERVDYAALDPNQLWEIIDMWAWIRNKIDTNYDAVFTMGPDGHFLLRAVGSGYWPEDPSGKFDNVYANNISHPADYGDDILHIINDLHFHMPSKFYYYTIENLIRDLVTLVYVMAGVYQAYAYPDLSQWLFNSATQMWEKII